MKKVIQYDVLEWETITLLTKAILIIRKYIEYKEKNTPKRNWIESIQEENG